MRQFGAHEPDWEPLEKALPPEKCEGFMFMGYCDGKRMYKHYITRKYLHLDEEGKAYRWDGYSRYFPQPLDDSSMPSRTSSGCCPRRSGPATTRSAHDPSL